MCMRKLQQQLQQKKHRIIIPIFAEHKPISNLFYWYYLNIIISKWI